MGTYLGQRQRPRKKHNDHSESTTKETQGPRLGTYQEDNDHNENTTKETQGTQTGNLPRTETETTKHGFWSRMSTMATPGKEGQKQRERETRPIFGPDDYRHIIGMAQ